MSARDPYAPEIWQRIGELCRSQAALDDPSFGKLYHWFDDEVGKLPEEERRRERDVAWMSVEKAALDVIDAQAPTELQSAAISACVAYYEGRLRALGKTYSK